jgi:hypothetical protein
VAILVAFDLKVVKKYFAVYGENAIEHKFEPISENFSPETKNISDPKSRNFT